MSGVATPFKAPGLSVRGDRPLARNTAVPEDPIRLADIDAEIEKAVVAAGVSSNPRDDQATRLRQLLSNPPSAPNESPERSLAASPTTVMRGPVSRPSQTSKPLSAPLPSSGMAQTVAIASGKGGVGKTSIAVNLAVTLASLGFRVTLLDADLGTANADLICGLSPKARLEHVLAPDGASGGAWGDAAPKSIREIAVMAPGGFRLVPGTAGVARMADLTNAQRATLVNGLADIERDSDIVLIDTAAGVGRSVTAMMDAADLALVIATPEPTSIADAYALIKCAMVSRSDSEWSDGSSPARCKVALVINQAVSESEARAVHGRISAVADRFLGVQCPMLGWIAQDLRVSEAVRARVPLVLRSPKSAASHNISVLAGSLVQRLGLCTLGGPPQPRSTGVSGLVRRLLSFSSPAPVVGRGT